MENVLVLLHDDAGQEARLQAALDLTRAVGGHLIGVDVAVPPAAGSFDGFSDTRLVQIAVECEAENRARVRQRLGGEDVSWTLLERTGWPAGELRAAADLADVIVVSSPAANGAPFDAQHLVNELVMKSRRPVLAVPPEVRGIDFTKPALIAWNGSGSACEALRAAVPILRLASSVTILEINAPDDGPSTSDAASYLSRSGIHAEVVRISGDGKVADTVLDHAQAMGVGCIVMGSFGLGRIVETLFGGVTVTLLNESDIPLFLAH